MRLRQRGEAVISSLRHLPVWMLLCAGHFLATYAGVANAQHSPADPVIRELHVGFTGVYKLGCWSPVEVILAGGTEPYTGSVTISVPDGDGVPSTFISPRPVGITPNQKTSSRLFLRVGQGYSALRVRFRSADGKVRADRTFYSSSEPSDGVVLAPLPATNRVILEFGPSVGLGDLLSSESPDELSRSHVVKVNSSAELPTEWYGYEGIDTVVLSTSQPELYRPLVQNTARVEALRRWVEMGGRLVIFCGNQAEELLAESGALQRLVPSKYDKVVELRESQPLEVFSGSEQAITSDRQVRFLVPTFSEIQGQKFAVASRGTEEVPLIVKSCLGFGEVTFVGLDFDRPPLRDWEGRQSFLTKALNWSPSDNAVPGNGTSGNVGEDLVTQIRNVLDGSFRGVRTIPFALVALLVVGYILLIGPGDYFFVHKILRRPELTWISFPLAVIAVSVGAYFFANWQKGDQLRVNQVEFLDLDTTSQQLRGTTWTHFFTPRVARFDLSFQPSFLADTALEESNHIVSWLGQPGYALGGMQSSTGQSTIFDADYAFAPGLDAMHNVPVQMWSTKTLTARWSAQVDPPLVAELSQTEEQLVAGTISNQSDKPLEDCVLLYGEWAWNVGQIAPHATIDLKDVNQPRTVRTLLTSATAGDTTITNTAEDGTVPFHLANNDLTRLAKTVMFYQAIHGQRYSSMLSRYQGFLDMSSLLAHTDRAVLLSHHQLAESRWLDQDKPLTSDQDRQWTYYRFVLGVGPVQPIEEQTSP